jgi:hypothetical protein
MHHRPGVGANVLNLRRKKGGCGTTIPFLCVFDRRGYPKEREKR